MAISAVTASANTYANAAGNTTITMTSPTGTQAGDLLLCLIGERSNVEAVTKVADTATGTLLFTPLRFGAPATSSTSVWYRVVQPGDPTSWTVTQNLSVHTEAALMAYRGVDPTTPIDAVGTTNTAISAQATFNAVTTVTPNAWYVGVLASSNGVAALQTPVSGSPTPTIRADAGNGGNTSTKEEVAILDVAPASAGASGAFVYNLVANNTWATDSFALRPSAGGGAGVHTYVAPTRITGWSSAQTVLQLATPATKSVEIVRVHVTQETVATAAVFGLRLYRGGAPVTWTAPQGVTPVPLIPGAAASACTVTAWGSSATDGAGATVLREDGWNVLASPYVHFPAPEERIVIAASSFFCVQFLSVVPSATYTIAVVFHECE